MIFPHWIYPSSLSPTVMAKINVVKTPLFIVQIKKKIDSIPKTVKYTFI
jgi:hypothetical protein